MGSMARTVNDAIVEVVRGRSFADMGGLWGTVNERVTVAAKAGASHVAMLDAQPEGTELWRLFAQRAAEHGVTGTRCVQINLDDTDLTERVGRFDVVHCSGVVYHCPDPFRSLRQLARLTRDVVIIGSMTVPEVIQNEHGTLDFRGGRIVSVPAMDEAARAVAAAHFASLGLFVHNINMAEPHPWRMPDGGPNYAPWWWLWHPATLARLAEAAGLRVVEVIEAWEGRAHALVCRV